MSANLDQTIQDLTTAVAAQTDAVNAVTPAITKEIQQVIAAVQNGADAVTQLQSAQAKLTPLTDALKASTQQVNDALAALNADDSTQPAP